MKIYKSDLPKLGYCSRGTRAFFLSQGWDWKDFLDNGIDIEIVKKSGHAMAMRLVELIEKEAEDGRK